MSSFVLDASMALAWFIDPAIPAKAMQVRQRLVAGDHAIVPALWRLEVANGLAMAERRGRLTTVDTAQILSRFENGISHAISESQQAPTIRQVLQSARQFQLTTYDAEYLETARLEHLPLATLARQLEAAAKRSGVPLI